MDHDAQHIAYMRTALVQARQAARLQEVPVGAVLVSAEGDILARAHNRTICNHDPSAHAEMLAIRQAGCRLVELKPNEVKKSITGHGHATKAQMQGAVQGVFGLAEPPSPPDIADALAIALCASRREQHVRS